MKYPTAPGTKVKQANNVKVDYSNISEGYITVKNNNDRNKQCRLSIELAKDCQYFMVPTDGTSKVFPLCFGNGKYCISVFKQIQGTSYSVVLTLETAVTLSSEFAPYLYPNTYSDYKPTSKCVSKANEICKGMSTDVERIRAINNWIINNVEYDHALAGKISSTDMSWWLPDPDTVVFEHKGICWGYASLFAAMCRSQGIPCKICVGLSQKSSHAWNTVYSKVNGDITGIQIVAKKWNRMDVTYMDTTRGNGKTIEYIAKDSNYKVSYFG